ncbi:DNA-binding protein [Azonexus sp.]|uniref:DNA-binding protein n=1 Tax=Azonexus sp. TaxID=1872668 RepID=UPI0035B199DC
MKPRTTQSPQEVRAEFLRKGQSIGSWADKHGFDRTTVNQVLTGRNAATRGTGHKIAVMLGLKDGEIVEESGHE